MDLKDMHIQQIENLMKYEFKYLVQESKKKEGFKFLKKLINEYENELNTFNKSGECLYGIFSRGKVNWNRWAKCGSVYRK